MRPPELKLDWATADGTVVTIRPITPADEAIELAFVGGLSADSRYLRFLAPIKNLTPRMLDKFINVDFPREMALIATIPSPQGEQEIGVARYALDDATGTAEFAIVVADAWQGQGIGRELLRQLFEIAQATGIGRMEGFVLKVNRKMLV
ncbi:MAG TPA: GNAT family N-acetyltransferase, partial [Gammaproteobacteria bacterium]|nr:GNAT family N-acetyltransferase [Gammaproteobacteria bacterium]